MIGVEPLPGMYRREKMEEWQEEGREGWMIRMRMSLGSGSNSDPLFRTLW